jgi:hypothetical protein
LIVSALLTCPLAISSILFWLIMLFHKHLSYLFRSLIFFSFFLHDRKYLIIIFLSLEISLNMMTSHRSAIWSSNPIPKGTWTTMFNAELFTVAKFWEQPRCPATGECIKKMWYLYTMEFYSSMKKNEILSLIFDHMMRREHTREVWG